MSVGAPSQYNCAESPCCRTSLSRRVRAIAPELPTRPLHARSSPRTPQIRDATAPTGLTTLFLQVMRRTRAVPVCPSTPASMPERNHHCGRLLGPNARLMTVWGLAEPDSSCIRHAEGVSARVLARGRSLAAPSNPSVRALLAMQLGSG